MASHENHLAFARLSVIADDGLERRGRDVIVGRKDEVFGQLAGPERLGDPLLVRSAKVASAHGRKGYHDIYVFSFSYCSPVS